MSERVKVSSKTPESKRDNSVSRIRKTDSSRSTSSPIDHILSLQKTIGNQAVQKLFKSGVIQAKLRIGQPNDIYEQEADRVAEQVMRMPEPQVQQQPEEEEEREFIQPKPLAGQITPLVQRQVEEEEDEILQVKEAPGQNSTMPPSVEPDIKSLKSGGHPLSKPERDFFEPRFGYDFSNVRLHTDSKAAETARALRARAFTFGSHIAFGAGDYLPQTASGRRVMAHELAHIIQQTRPRTALRRFPVGTDRLVRMMVSDAPYGIMRWTRKGVLGLLCSDPDGKATVKVLKSSSVYSYKSYTIKRQYYTDATKTTKKGPPKYYDVKGYHSRKKKKIGVKTKRTNAKAASTFVHEVVHAKQHMAYEKKLKVHPKATPPTKAEKEYEAHIKQEEFNIRKGIPPKHPSFRKRKGARWIVDKVAIKKWVDRVYAIGPKVYYNEWIIDNKVDEKGPLGPWVCP